MSKEAVLLLHNSDATLDEESLQGLTNAFRHVFASNTTNETPGLSALPLGLENRHKNKLGKLKYFPKHPSLVNLHSKKNLVVSSFNVSTNPNLRANIAETLRQSRHGHRSNFMKQGQYFNLVRESFFVISPPGNGIDCHRTWESLYLGAIPVVLQGCLAKSIVESLPILEVESYDRFCEYTDLELLEQFYELSKKPRERLFLRFWSAKFRAAIQQV